MASYSCRKLHVLWHEHFITVTGFHRLSCIDLITLLRLKQRTKLTVMVKSILLLKSSVTLHSNFIFQPWIHFLIYVLHIALLRPETTEYDIRLI